MSYTPDLSDLTESRPATTNISQSSDKLITQPKFRSFNSTKKEIEELSTSYNDTQARSQSLNTKITLDSSNSQDMG